MSSWVIGGRADCDVVVDRPTVSGRHCCLTQEADGFCLEDLNSTNGTFVNGQRITGRVRVSPSDRITLGSGVPLPWPFQKDLQSTRTITIGGAADNDVILDFPMVSGYHARLLVTDKGVILEDLGSSNGTFINSRDNRITRAPLAAGDIVFLGSHQIAARELFARISIAPADVKPALKSDASTLVISQQAIVLGRDPECEQVLDHPMVSWRHARILRTDDSFLVEDLGSTNGTFINGQRITGVVSVQPGDEMGLGSYTFRLTAGAELEKRDYRGNLALEARGVTVDVPGKRLLEDVSLVIYPAEFVGLMGPSGSGKSTLMNVLNGYTRPATGAVLLNGCNLYQSYDMFRGQLGYVPQDDIMHADLTVGQALYFSARLRLPSDFSDAELQSRIKKVLEQLGLQGTENVLIGSPDKKGISGGQRKRVNLAMELLTDPSVLFLDEPTSGLSSEDTLTVMKLLRSLADEGKTILLTIHQPSLEAFRLMDNLVLVARDGKPSAPGQLVYYGRAYPESVHFFNPAGVASPPGVDPSPDEVLRGLAQQPASYWGECYAASAHRRTFVEDRASRQVVERAQPVQRTAEPLMAVRQAWTLVRRCVQVKLKDTWNTALLMAQAPIIAILIALVFGKQVSQQVDPSTWPEVAHATATTVFLLALSALWFGCSNSAREIVGEWAIYRRERMVNLRISSYVGSKFLVLVGQCLIQCLVLLGIVYWGSGLHGSWWGMFFILLLASAVGVGIGLCISALARTSEMAIALLPIVILPMVILGGVLQPVHKMNTVAKWLSIVAPSRWAFEGLLVLEAGQRPSGAMPAGPTPGGGVDKPAAKTPSVERRPEEDMAEKFFPIKTERMGTRADAGVLFLMLLVLAGSVGAILRARDIH